MGIKKQLKTVALLFNVRHGTDDSFAVATRSIQDTNCILVRRGVDVVEFEFSRDGDGVTVDSGHGLMCEGVLFDLTIPLAVVEMLKEEMDNYRENYGGDNVGADVGVPL